MSNTISMDASPAKWAEAPVFVVGIWRSGTSLLQVLLNQHPDIGLLYEGELPLLWPLFRSPSRASWAARWDFWNGALSRHRIPLGAVPEEKELPAAFAAVGQYYANQKGAQIWGCKSPNYFDLVPRLADWYPNARFIFVWREPSDICRSVARAAQTPSWFRRPGMHLRVILGFELLRDARNLLIRRGAAVHDLDYGDLIADTAGQMQLICDFLQIRYASEMTSLQNADLSSVYDGDHHQLLRKASATSSDHSVHGIEVPARIKGKLARYKVRWKQLFPDATALSHSPQPNTTSAPSAWELLFDRTQFGILRCLDWAPRFVFPFTPTWIWQIYRKVKYRKARYFIQSPAMRESESLVPPGQS
jgi:hypothetical protein